MVMFLSAFLAALPGPPAASHVDARDFSLVRNSKAESGADEMLGKRGPALAMGIVTVVMFSEHFPCPLLQVLKMCGRWKGWTSLTSWNESLLETRALAMSGQSTIPAIIGAAYSATQGEPQMHAVDGSGSGALGTKPPPTSQRGVEPCITGWY